MRSSSEIVKSLQHWDKLKPTIKDSFDEALSIYKEACTTKPDYIQYPKNLVSNIIQKIVESKSLNDKEIKKSIQEQSLNESSTNYFLETVDLYSSIRRVKMNHKIISKRFDLDTLIFKDKSRDDIDFLFYDTSLGYFKICSYLDTYNLSIQDKVNLMTEEILYLAIKYFGVKETINSDKVADIITTILVYIFGTYPADGVPEEIIDKIKKYSFSKINNSLFIQNIQDHLRSKIMNGINYEALVLGTDRRDYIHPKFTKLKVFMQTNNFLFGEITGYGNNTEVFANTIDKDLFYFYFVFTDNGTVDQFKQWIHRMIHPINSSSNPKLTPNLAVAILAQLKINLNKISYKYKDYIHNDHIQEYIDILASKIEEEQNEKEKQEAIDYAIKHPLTIDPEDEAFGFEDTTDYNKKVYNKFKEAYATYVAATSLNEDTFNQTFANPEFIVKEDNDLIKSIADISIAYPYTINPYSLKRSYTEALNSLRKKAPIDNNTLHKINALNSSIGSINKFKFTEYDDNQKDMTADEPYNINNINSVNDFIDSNKKDMANLIEAVSAINTCGAQLLHENSELQSIDEMKLTSYATLALDRVKNGINYLDDKQKSAFMTIDRIADSIENINDKDAKDEARMQIVRGRLLPSMSKCLKTILTVGLLSLINVYLGILAVVIKFVSAKNALKTERQAVADELEVELEMIDSRIDDAKEAKDYPKERRMRLLKKKMLTQYARISVDNKMKWNDELVMKPDKDKAALLIGLKGDD